MIPVSVRYRSSQVPQHFCHSFSPTSTDSLETSSVVGRLLTPITPISQYSQYEQKEDMVFISPLPDIVHQPKKEHNETMQRYDRLLEKMRATDEQLQTLSRSWINNRQQKTSVSTKNPFIYQLKIQNFCFRFDRICY
jgi:predicted O-linked N-acetylglucosamine transferase (SPINDLY family)